jgi:glucan endo-1,3-alpha-glucosidase
MTLAIGAGIDGFVLNTAPNTQPGSIGLAGNIGKQVDNAFIATSELGLTFKLFFSFDYLGAGQPWDQAEVKKTLIKYANHPAYFRYNNRAYVSTFEGTNNINDWPSIKSAVPGGVFFVPDWTSLGPSGIKSHLDIIDGAFSWDMWPHGNQDMTTSSDLAWKAALAGKHYMMGISPWFYTKLPAYNKAWVWRGDSLWHTRWDQISQVQPDIVQIVTWNDYGESHYIGPIIEEGIPQGPGADARPYVNNMPHDAWRNLLPYYITCYKNNGSAPAVSNEKIQYWYRLTPAAAGRTDGVTGSNGPIYDPTTIVQDRIFITALTNGPANVTVQIGSNAPRYLSAWVAGANHFALPFNGQTGAVSVNLVRDGEVVVQGMGEAIQAAPGGNGATNFNAWVGGASG